MFRFKQFTVAHDRCAMKVGTDGVLLGAWAGKGYESVISRILDIGTGSGLVSLMLAQRMPIAQIDAVEIDSNAAKQANENFQASSWSQRITTHEADISQWSSDNTYDLIVSNPPYFSNSLPASNPARTIARHDSELSIDALFDSVERLLSPGGSFVAILPFDVLPYIRTLCRRSGLFLIKELSIRPTPNSSPKRILFECKRNPSNNPLREEMSIEYSRHCYSEEYVRLTSDFYLKM